MIPTQLEERACLRLDEALIVLHCTVHVNSYQVVTAIGAAVSP